MTWCGHQGFQTPPNNTFLINGKNMGNWGYEVRLFSFHPLDISAQKKQEWQHSLTMAPSHSGTILVINMTYNNQFHHSPSSQLQFLSLILTLPF